MKKVITSTNAPLPIGPYSHGNLVAAGNMLFVSGQVAKDAKTGVLTLDNIKSETKKVMENVQAVLTEGGMDFTNVVKTTIFMVGGADPDFSSINKVYKEFFLEEPPARSAPQVMPFPSGILISIECIALA